MTDYLINVALPEAVLDSFGKTRGRNAVLRLLGDMLAVFDAAAVAKSGPISHLADRGHGRSAVLCEDRALLAVTGALPSEIW